MSPEQNLTGISMLPMSLQKLLQETEYPPHRPVLMMARTNKVVMIVDTVSPTPFALLRRANHFQYRESDWALQEFSDFEDPVQALTEECRRVLKSVSAANQSQVSSSKHSTSLRDASWSRFEDIGFSSALEEEEEDDESALPRKQPQALRSSPSSGNGLGRPTTPSWADFLSSGFVDDNPTRSNLLLPPDKVLPPLEIQPRQRSSQSHRPRLESDTKLEPGELASITDLDLDEAFWWVWMSSLAPEEPPERKAAFGRCAVVETKVRTGRWLVMEEMIAGAGPEPEEGAYIAEKKSLFSWARRGKTMGRRRSTGKHALDQGKSMTTTSLGLSKTSIGPDTHARIQAKAAQLRAHENQEKQMQEATRRGRVGGDATTDKTNSVLTLQPAIIGEATSAMSWVKKYDKGAIREAYMANSSAGRGIAVSPEVANQTNEHAEANGAANGHASPPPMPVKDTTPAPAPASVVPQTPVAQPEQDAQEPVFAADSKADEAGVHPLEMTQDEEPRSPIPPPKDDAPIETAEESVTQPVPVELSPESKSKQKKLHKDNKERSSGFKKLFGRKNRASKLPKSASAPLQTTLRPDPSTSEVNSMHRTESAAASVDDGFQGTTQGDEVDEEPTTPKAAAIAEPTYDPSIGESLSHVDTQDADEAKKEFSRFDQGPLSDQPSFSPGDDDADDATPPPISRRPVPRSNTSQSGGMTEQKPEERLSQSAGPGVQDRWAQIRKNAADRAAGRPGEEAPRYRQRSATDEGDDTSGEESKYPLRPSIKSIVPELTMSSYRVPSRSYQGPCCRAHRQYGGHQSWEGEVEPGPYLNNGITDRALNDEWLK